MFSVVECVYVAWKEPLPRCYVFFIIKAKFSYWFSQNIFDCIAQGSHWFLHVLHYAFVAWFLLVQLKLWIILKLVDLYVADWWRWVPWWLLISPMKKISLDMRNWFMILSYEVVKSPFDARCVIKKASCVRCVDTSVTRWEMLIWSANTNLHTLSIQDSVCNHCSVSM